MVSATTLVRVMQIGPGPSMQYMGDASCIQIKPGGTRGGGILEDNYSTLHRTI